MVASQKIQAGMIHAGKTVTVICESNHFRLVIDGETVAVVPVGNPAYGLGQLRGDLARFAFLLGGDDGESLFGPAQPP